MNVFFIRKTTMYTYSLPYFIFYNLSSLIAPIYKRKSIWVSYCSVCRIFVLIMVPIYLCLYIAPSNTAVVRKPLWNCFVAVRGSPAFNICVTGSCYCSYPPIVLGNGEHYFHTKVEIIIISISFLGIIKDIILGTGH